MSGSIGVTVRSRPPAVFGLRLPAMQVFFVKLEDGNEAFSATDLIRSSHRYRGRIYLLNADPGRYVAVAAVLGSTKREEVTVDTIQIGPISVSSTTSREVGSDYIGFFSMAMISETEVTVVPQEMVFVGEYLVSTSTKMKKADLAQAHYFRLLLPGEAGRGSVARQFSGQSASIADIKSVFKDTETEREFWITARDKAFKGDPGWQAQAHRQLDAMEKREPN